MNTTLHTFQARCPDIECDGCANSIQRALGRLAGVQSVQVDVTEKRVSVEYESANVTAEAIRSRLEQAGFPADPGTE